MNLDNLSLRDGVKNVRTSSTDSDDHDLRQSQLCSYHADARAAARRVEVSKYRLRLIGGNGWKRPYCCCRIQDLCWSQQHVGVCGHLLVVILVRRLRLVGKGAARDKSATEIDRTLLVNEPFQRLPKFVAGQVAGRCTNKVDDVISRGSRPISCCRDFGCQDAHGHGASRGHIRNTEQEEVRSDFEVVSLVLELLEVWATTYQWP